MLENGIDGKMYWAMKSLYCQNEARVKINNQMTDWFSCTYGVRQGDTLSPTLFSIFINDLASIINRLNKGINIGNSQISILLYANDVVLLADSEAKLQEMLDHLHEWSTKWKISINKQKSKVIHLCKRNIEQSNHVFKVGPLIINYTDKYKYLGTYFSEFLSFEENAEILSESAGRALGAIVSKLKRNNFMGYSMYTKLYDMCVAPIIDYSSEIWGYKNYCKTNVVQNRAMRIFLCVHRFAPVAGLEGDMAWLSPQFRRWLKMLWYWNRLVKMDNNRCTKAVFNWAL